MKAMDDIPYTVPARPVRFIDRFRHFIRSRHYKYTTEQTYVKWVLHYIRYHGKRHPDTMGTAEIELFLNHLAVERNVAKGTQAVAVIEVLEEPYKLTANSSGPVRAKSNRHWQLLTASSSR